jgi:hypothetical protein
MSRSNLQPKTGKYIRVPWQKWNYMGYRSVEIGFPPPGDTGRQDTPCSRMLQPAWQEGLQQVQKRREPGRQAPGQCCKVHSVSKIRFHQKIIA